MAPGSLQTLLAPDHFTKSHSADAAYALAAVPVVGFAELVLGDSTRA